MIELKSVTIIRQYEHTY